MNQYLLEIQFLGYRYSGWMKQPKVKTVQEMIEKTILFIYPESKFRTIGTSRTDARVSAIKMGVLLVIDQTIDEKIDIYNKNLPNDIRLLKVKKINEKINPLKSVNNKHYIYLFASGEKPHPFSAALIHTELKELDIPLMQQGAKLFEGEHNFQKYCTKPKPGTKFIRTIDSCQIEVNHLFKANFFPETSYVLHIKSTGFMRYQIRLIMGQLLALGKGELTIDFLKTTLNPVDNSTLRHIAPGSGLILYNTEID